MKDFHGDGTRRSIVDSEHFTSSARRRMGWRGSAKAIIANGLQLATGRKDNESGVPAPPTPPTVQTGAAAEDDNATSRRTYVTFVSSSSTSAAAGPVIVEASSNLEETKEEVEDEEDGNLDKQESNSSGINANNSNSGANSCLLPREISQDVTERKESWGGKKAMAKVFFFLLV